MKESKLQKQILDYCRTHGIYATNIYGAGRCAKGTPDLLLCIHGYYVAMECKVGNNQLQDDQIIHRNRILKAGGVWSCPRSLDDAIAVIKDVEAWTKDT